MLQNSARMNFRTNADARTAILDFIGGPDASQTGVTPRLPSPRTRDARPNRAGQVRPTALTCTRNRRHFTVPMERVALVPSGERGESARVMTTRTLGGPLLRVCRQSPLHPPLARPLPGLRDHACDS